MEQVLLVDAEGNAFVQKTERVPVTGLGRLSEELLGNLCIRLPSITPDLALIYTLGKSLTGYKRIRKLQLSTVWSILEDQNGESHLSPTFGAPPPGTDNNSAPGVETTRYQWDVPEDMLLFFIVPTLGIAMNSWPNLPSQDHSEAITIQTGLIAFDRETHRQYRLPLPNVHNDGRLCPGILNTDPRYLLTKMEGIYASWHANRWNSDLISSTQGKYEKLIRLKVENGETLPPEGGDWRTHCIQISSTGWLSQHTIPVALEGL